jgi:hypothetical protein
MMFAGPMTIGTVNAALSASIIGSYPGRGSVTETFVIPLSVLKKAVELGKTSIRYTRTFSTPGIGTGFLNITQTSPSAVELNITNMHLYFENKRSEITVKRKEPGLKAYADINFVGKGLFKGYWQVDGRIISYVNKNLAYGRILTIATPDLPSLPTFMEGTHVVQFIIQRPNQGIEFPKALYYVTPGETTETAIIIPISPFDLAVLERKSPMFNWQSSKPLPIYLLEFMEEENGDPVFSAYTSKSEYTVPEVALKGYLKSPQPYYWRVTGFDSESNIAGESEVRQVRFKAE